MEDVAGHVAEGAGAEVPPAAEVPRGIDGMVRTVRGRSEEEIPVEGLGDLLRLGGTLQALGPDGTVREGLDAGDLADLAVPDPVADLADAFAGSALVAHLGGDAVLRGQLGQKAGLVHGTGERLLAVDVLAGHDRVRGDDGVRVVRGGDHHGIGLIEHLVEHHAPVLVALGVRIALEDVRGILPVHVAEADDFFGLQAAEDAGAPAADTDAENLEFAVQRGRSPFFTVGEHFAGNHGKPEGRRRSCLQERSS